MPAPNTTLFRVRQRAAGADRRLAVELDQLLAALLALRLCIDTSLGTGVDGREGILGLSAATDDGVDRRECKTS